MARILIVEDTPASMKLLVIALEKSGHAALQAERAPEAIAIARREKPDLVLMDIQLPGMDGLEAARILKTDAATRGIPVIALTAHAMAGDREKALAAGCDDYDTKPIELPRLLAKIESLLGKKAAPAQGKDHA